MAKITREQIAENDLFGDIGKSAVDNKTKVKLFEESIKSLTKLANDLKGKLNLADPSTLQGINDLNKMTADANQLAKDRKTVNEELAKAQKKVNDENAKSIKQIEKLTADLDKLKRERVALNKAEKAGTITAKEANKERARLNVAIKQTGKELNEATKRQLGLITAIDDEKKKLRDLIKAREGLSLAGKDNTKAARALENQIERTAKGIDKAEKSTRRFKRGFSAMRDSVEGVRQKLNKLMAALGIVAGFQLFRRVVGDAVTIIRDFEKANAELAGVLNTNLSGVSKLTENAKQLGATTAFTASQVTALQIAYSRLGFTQDEILNLTEGTINGAIALNAGLDETAEVAGAVVRTFQSLKTTDTALILDKLTASTQKSALNFEKLQKSLPIVGGAAEAAGIGFDKLLALLGKLSDAGIDASTSATALRNIFIESSAQGLSYEQILDKIVKEQDKLTASTDAFGKRAAVSATVLANNIKATGELEEIIGKAGGTAERVAETQLDTLDGSIKLLQSAWEGWILKINDSIGANAFLRDTIKFLANNLEQILNVVLKVAQVWLTYKGTILLVNTAMKVQAVVTNTLKIAKIGLSGGIRKATIAMKSFNAAQRANIIGAVAAVVLVLVQEINKLVTATTAAEDAQAAFNEQLAKEQAQLELTFQKLKETAEGTEERTRLIKEINKEYGPYLENLLTEESTLEDIEKAQKAANAALQQKIGLQVREDAIAESLTKKITRQQELNEMVLGFLPKAANETKNLSKFTEGVNDILERRLELLRQEDEAQKLGTKEREKELKRLSDAAMALGDESRALGKEFGTDNIFRNITGNIDFAAKQMREFERDIEDINNQFSFLDKKQVTIDIETDPADPVDAVDPTQTETDGDGDDDGPKTRLEELEALLKKNREAAEKLADEFTTADNEALKALNTEGRVLKQQIDQIKELLKLEQEVKEKRNTFNALRLRELQAEFEAQQKLVALDPFNQGVNVQDANFIDREAVEFELQSKLRAIRLEAIEAERKEALKAIEKGEGDRGKLLEKLAKLQVEELTIQNKQRAAEFQRGQEEILKEELDLQNEFLDKKLNNEFKNDEEIEKAEKELQRKLLQLHIDRLENERLLLDEESLEYKKLTEKILNLQQQQADLDKKSQEDQQQRFETQRLVVETFTDFFIVQADRRIDKINEEIAAAERQADVLRGLAENGTISARESLAQQEQIIAEAQRRREELERRKQRVLLASAVLQAYNTELAAGKSSGEAFTSAITSAAVLTQFIEALPTFFEGTDNVGQALGSPHLNTARDQYVVRVDKDERIVDPSNNKKIGDYTNAELAQIAENHRAGKYIVDARYMQASNGGQTASNELLSEIRAMRHDIQNQPTHEGQAGDITSTYMEWKETTTRGNEVTTNAFIVK